MSRLSVVVLLVLLGLLALVGALRKEQQQQLDLILDQDQLQLIRQFSDGSGRRRYARETKIIPTNEPAKEEEKEGEGSGEEEAERVDQGPKPIKRRDVLLINEPSPADEPVQTNNQTTAPPESLADEEPVAEGSGEDVP